MNTRLSFLVVIALILFSCESKKLKSEAEKQTKSFFSALKEGNETKMKELYSDFTKFDSYFKSDSVNISTVNYKDNIVTVSARNRFTNGFGKLTEKDIFLFFKQDSVGQLKLFDSKGLTGFDEKDEYIFGVGTGCLNTAIDTTDQQILKAIKKAEKVMVGKALDVWIELKKDIVVSDWSWESGYQGSASGKGIVKNNSTFSVPSLKYKITYKTNSGDEITSDNGYVTYDLFQAGESKSFTFYTSYVGNASRASIELLFDDDTIFKYLVNKEWTGNECDDYFTENPDKLSELE
ncbi:hypothetical protein Belba_0588 [Belliella baltica DSM 15883]|uniref:Uncharacterized protein n=1 Tax=Belliella baltica (strain DSM 15883 / CIP 108006 / LMG 21964 / BA134) TaxID=866536 RepID=I3Z1X7_BELBD|nr:hypothetical protein [Belliella baltica]AFL83245.1 hypothetical protein Belba_0588 [Belliella baltica DSM 15883]